MDIYPVLNCREATEIEAGVRSLRTFLPATGWIHLDIADGIFTPHKTWNEPTAWPSFRANYNLEVHLMVEDPERQAPAWFAVGARRVIIHYESLTDRQHQASNKKPQEIMESILSDCWRANAELFLSTNPETPIHALKPFFEKCTGAQVLSVHPGLAGQKFLPAMLEKVEFLRKTFPNATIEVDGGINPETGRMVRRVGADVATAGSYIFQSPDPAKAY